MDISNAFKALSDALSQATEETIKYAGETADIAKLMFRQNKLDSEISNEYAEIGHLIYTQYKDQTDLTEEVAAKCLDLDEKTAELNQIIADIAAIRAAQEANRTAKAKERADAMSKARATVEKTINNMTNGNSKSEDATVESVTVEEDETVDEVPVEGPSVEDVEVKSAEEEAPAEAETVPTETAEAEEAPAESAPTEEPVEETVVETETDVPTEKTCPKCGATIPADAKFCHDCGAQL